MAAPSRLPGMVQRPNKPVGFVLKPRSTALSAATSAVTGAAGSGRSATVETVTTVPIAHLLPPDELGHIRYKNTVLRVGPSDIVDEGELGRGAFGIVKKIRHKGADVCFAVKEIRDVMRPMERARLLMELQLVRSTNSPFIVDCFGVNEADGDICIFMEMMLASLEKVYKDVRPVPFPDAVLGRITVSVLRGLSYLKTQCNVMHRDVKPSNILMGDNGSIKLCDFGIAETMENSIVNSHQGCENYLSPERLNPETAGQSYDVRSDVWALGITLSEIALQRFPYEGAEKHGIFVLLRMVVEGPAPVLPETLAKYRPKFEVAALLAPPGEAAPLPALIEHAYIQQHSDSMVDVAAWYRAVMADKPSPVAHS